MKKLWLLFVLFSFSLLVVGCTDKPTDDDDDDDLPKDTIMLDYASFENQEVEALLIAEFEKLHPNIKVRLRSDVLEMSGVADNFTASLVSLAAIGDTPDVFQVIQIDPTGSKSTHV